MSAAKNKMKTDPEEVEPAEAVPVAEVPAELAKESKKNKRPKKFNKNDINSI